MIHLFDPSSKTRPDSISPNDPIRWTWISMQEEPGKTDAKDFLHRLSTVNLKTLPVGRGAPGCFLSAQGKIRAFFYLWRYSDTEYGFEFDAGKPETVNPSAAATISDEVPGAWNAALLQFIDQYTFSEKFTLTETSKTGAFETRWLFFDSENEVPADFPQGSGETSAHAGSVRLCNHGKLDYGKVWISIWGTPEKVNQFLGETFSDASKVDLSLVESWRIQALRPRIDHEIDQETMPVEVGLTDAVSPNKGCYPGQEVIEKIISLGSPPRRLCLISGEGRAPTRGQAIFNQANPPVEVGFVGSSIQEGDRYMALAVIRKIHAKEGLEIGFKTSTETNTKPQNGSIIKISTYES
ncbi:MAG: hypothetical protein HYX41_06860 [Bdellovibrio sp.]|nr:hypothetical protein [Bdellovibrio sp.]